MQNSVARTACQCIILCISSRGKLNLTVHNHQHSNWSHVKITIIKHCIQSKRGLGHCTASKPWPDYVLHYTQTIPPLLLRLHLVVAQKALLIIPHFKWHWSIYIPKFGLNVSFGHHCTDQRIYRSTLFWRGRKIVVISILRRCDLALALQTLKPNWMPTLHLWAGSAKEVHLSIKEWYSILLYITLYTLVHTVSYASLRTHNLQG